MTLAIARYVQAHPKLFSAERRVEADRVAGVDRDLHRIMVTVPAPRAGTAPKPRRRRV